jgi:hypothetical protein
MTPIDNDFDASIVATGTVTGTTQIAGDSDCPNPYDAVYLQGSANEGNTYLYYYVTVVDHNKNFDWKALVDVDGVDNEQYSLNGSTGWTDMDAAVTFTDITSQDYFYVRVSVPVGTSQVAYDASVTATECLNTACSKEASDSDSGNDDAQFNLNPVPDLSGVGFN